MPHRRSRGGAEYLLASVPSILYNSYVVIHQTGAVESFAVTSKGQVTIPKSIRRALGIRQGSRVTFTEREGKVELQVVHRPPESIASGFGMLGARGKHVPVDFDVASLLATGPRRSR